MKPSKICLALDGLSAIQAIDLTEKLGDRCHAVKIHDLFDACGASIIRSLKESGAKRVWVDAKLHDTKDTVALRTAAIVRHGASIITVHASGGIPMMRAAVEAAHHPDRMVAAEIWAITVLSSLDPREIGQVYGRDQTPQQIVTGFALMAKEAGVSGIVCSAQEVDRLSQYSKLKGLEFVVPGTRSVGADLGQQKRSGTPKQASDDGATFLVAGSQVTKAKDPVAAFDAFEAEIA